MSVVLASYNGQEVAFTDDGWFNATEAAAKYGRRVDVWLKSQETKDYIAALCEISNSTEKRYLKARRGVGGGTWLHPKLAVQFARWLDPRFAIWCDAQIDNLIHGKQDWQLQRYEAAASSNVMQHIVQISRATDGKGCAPHHYSNEARLVNWALIGEFKGLDRESLGTYELSLLARLQEHNAVLIARGQPYEKRKEVLERFALDHRVANMPGLAHGIARKKGETPKAATNGASGEPTQA